MNMIIRGLWENIGSIYLVWGWQLGGFSWRSDIFNYRSEWVGVYRQSGWRPAFQAERCAKALRQESENEVAQSCPTLCDTMDSSLPGFSVHGILQARILEWVTISFSRGSSQSRDRTWVSCIGGRCFKLWAIREGRKGCGIFEGLKKG